MLQTVWIIHHLYHLDKVSTNLSQCSLYCLEFFIHNSCLLFEEMSYKFVDPDLGPIVAILQHWDIDRAVPGHN